MKALFFGLPVLRRLVLIVSLMAFLRGPSSAQICPFWNINCINCPVTIANGLGTLVYNYNYYLGSSCYGYCGSLVGNCDHICYYLTFGWFDCEDEFQQGGMDELCC
jgi:hypothetical protein